jgi:hypothetical protein
VTVTASGGGSDVTDAAGAYSIAGVAAGAGTLTITGAPAECTPAPEAYTMTSAGTITEDVIVPCVAPPTPGYQYNTTWTALPGNQIQLDIRLDMRTFDRADITNVTTGGALGGTGDPLVGIQLAFTYDATKLTFVEEQTAVMGSPRVSSAPVVNGSVPGQVSLLTGTVGTTFFTGNVGIVRIIFDRVAGSVGAVGTTTSFTAANSRTGGSNLSILANIVNTESTFILP